MKNGDSLIKNVQYSQNNMLYLHVIEEYEAKCRQDFL